MAVPIWMLHFLWPWNINVSFLFGKKWCAPRTPQNRRHHRESHSKTWCVLPKTVVTCSCLLSLPWKQLQFFHAANLVGIQISTPKPPPNKEQLVTLKFQHPKLPENRWLDSRDFSAMNWSTRWAPNTRYKLELWVPSKWPQYKFVSSAITTVNKHSNGKSPSWIGNTSSNGGFSMAMLDYRSV